MTKSTDQNGGSLLGSVDKPLFAISGGFIALFCLYALVDIDGLSALVDAGLFQNRFGGPGFLKKYVYIC